MAEYRPVPIATRNQPLAGEEEAREAFRMKVLMTLIERALAGSAVAQPITKQVTENK